MQGKYSNFALLNLKLIIMAGVILMLILLPNIGTDSETISDVILLQKIPDGSIATSHTGVFRNI